MGKMGAAIVMVLAGGCAVDPTEVFERDSVARAIGASTSVSYERLDGDCGEIPSHILSGCEVNEASPADGGFLTAYCWNGDYLVGIVGYLPTSSETEGEARVHLRNERGNVLCVGNYLVTWR